MPGQKTGIGVANNPNVKVIRVELPIATSSSSISNSATGNTLQPVYVPADLGEIFVQDTDKSSEHLQVPIENINASEELPHHGGQEETVVMEAPDIHTIGAEEMAQDITQQVVVNTGQLEPNVNSVSDLSSLGGTQTVVISAPQGSHQVSLEGLPIQLSQLASGQTFQILSAGGSDASAGGTASVVRTTPAVKRQLTSMGASSNPNVTKVIITKNPNASQPGTMLTQSQLQNLNLTSMMPGVSVLPAPASPQKQAKTITISTQGILSPLTGSRPMTSVLSSPAKLISKIPISPSKTPTKITMIPISKTPTKITPGSGQVSILSMASGAEGGMLGNASSATASSQPVSIVTMSPTKLKPTVQQRQTISLGGTPVSLQSGASGTIKQIALPIGQTVQGSKFQYVRLVTPSSQAKSNPQLTSLVQPKTLTSLPTGSQQPQLITISGSQIGKSGQPLQRIILPAPSQTIRQISSATTLQSIRPAITSTLAQLSGGTILSSGGVSGSLQGYAIVPASYVTQLQSQTISSSKSDTMHPQELPSVPPPQPIIHPAPPPASKEFVPIASNDPFVSASALARTVLNGVSPTTAIEPTGARPRKPCNCTKSQCLKLYCDCFANGEFCHNCNCTNCANNLDHEEERSKAIKSCLDRNPMAFHPKIGSGKGKEGDGDRRHNKGCNCKRSGCLKNYCECYEAKIMCSSFCKCIGCKNFEESPERKTLMHLADAAEVREQQQVAAKTKLSSQISGVPTRPPISVTGERLPYTFITSEVAEATCACLLAQAEEAERLKMPPVVQERMVIEEFGRCLMQIIESAQKTRDEAES